MKKSLIIFLLMTAMVITSCTPENKQLRELKQGEILVTDSSNRQVILDQNPQRIAAIFSPAVHIISALGGSKQIQSVSKGNMRDILLLEIFPEIKKARTPKGGGDFNIEELIKHPSPDLIICDRETANDEGMLDKMDDLGIPVVTIDFKNIEQQKNSIHMIGKILDKELKAKEYCDEIDNSMEFIKDRIERLNKTEEKTIYHSVNELLRTDIEGSVTTEVMKALKLKQYGVKRLGNEGNKNYINLEELLSYDPDLFIVNGEDVFRYINQSEQFKSLKSHKQGHIYNLPTGISRWGQHYSVETALFSKWLAKTAYPNDFKDIDMKKEAKNFYRKYMDTELDDKTIDEILEGTKRGVFD